MLLRKKLITAEEWEEALEDEANQLNADYSRKFPGVTATDHGLVLDIAKLAAADSWMKNWKP